MIKHCFLLVVLFIPQILGLTERSLNNTSTSGLYIDATPTSYLPGLTTSLTVNCSFLIPFQTTITDIMSLIISKKSPGQSTFNEIATLVSTTPDQITVKNPSLSAATTGHLSQKEGVYIALEWTHPSRTIEGRYQCELFGSDKNGHPKVLIADVDVIKDTDVTPTALLGEIKSLTSRLDKLETLQSASNDRLTAAMSAVFVATSTLAGHTYRLSRPMLRDISMHDHLCRLFGGYLVEIDSNSEYLFIEDWVLKQHGVGRLAMGISDRDHEGNFTFIASGHPAPVFKRGDGYNGDGDCAEMWVVYGPDGYVDEKCYGPGYGGNYANPFVCEFPN